jgi:hypothetical protein
MPIFSNGRRTKNNIQPALCRSAIFCIQQIASNVAHEGDNVQLSDVLRTVVPVSAKIVDANNITPNVKQLVDRIQTGTENKKRAESVSGVLKQEKIKPFALRRTYASFSMGRAPRRFLFLQIFLERAMLNPPQRRKPSPASAYLSIWLRRPI